MKMLFEKLITFLVLIEIIDTAKVNFEISKFKAKSTRFCRYQVDFKNLPNGSVTINTTVIVIKKVLTQIVSEISNLLFFLIL